VDELLDRFHGAKFLSNFDMKLEYYQIRIREEDIPKTAFYTHKDLYEFHVMPFGLSNTSTTFHTTMNDLFHPFLQMYLCYLIVWWSITQNWSSHLKHVETMLKLLEENKLYEKKLKCSFGREEK
jgi:hypothetical protein